MKWPKPSEIFWKVQRNLYEVTRKVYPFVIGGYLFCEQSVPVPVMQGITRRDIQRHVIRLSVSDNRMGMTQSTIKKIFEPYFTTKENVINKTGYPDYHLYRVQ